MFKINGLNALLKEIQEIENDSMRVLEAELKTIADDIMSKALSRLPSSSGEIRGTAFVNPIENGWVLGFSAKIAPYIEFGTGRFVDVPNGFEEYAMQFYVNGKGITRPNPFFLRSFFEERDKAVEKLTEALKSHFKLS